MWTRQVWPILSNIDGHPSLSSSSHSLSARKQFIGVYYSTPFTRFLGQPSFFHYELPQCSRLVELLGCASDRFEMRCRPHSICFGIECVLHVLYKANSFRTIVDQISDRTTCGTTSNVVYRVYVIGLHVCCARAEKLFPHLRCRGLLAKMQPHLFGLLTTLLIILQASRRRATVHVL